MRRHTLQLLLFVMLAVTVVAIPTQHAMANAAESAQDISSPPPAPIYEIDPGNRPGYIRTPGYWRWNGKRHVWVPSRWVAVRENATWVPDQWEQHGQKWHFAEGHWETSEVAEETDEVDDTPVPVASGKPTKKQVSHKKHTSNYHNQAVWPRHIGR